MLAKHFVDCLPELVSYGAVAPAAGSAGNGQKRDQSRTRQSPAAICRWRAGRETLPARREGPSGREMSRRSISTWQRSGNVLTLGAAVDPCRHSLSPAPGAQSRAILQRPGVFLDQRHDAGHRVIDGVDAPASGRRSCWHDLPVVWRLPTDDSPCVRGRPATESAQATNRGPSALQCLRKALDAEEGMLPHRRYRP